MERLDKILAAAGAGSRSDVKAVIRAGRVKVNGNTVKDPQQKISEEDVVMLDGKALNTSKFRYYMLNKPCGLISSTREEAGGAGTVTGLFQNEGVKDLFPVGRLDKDTSGLLIVTNDGRLGHTLTSPSYHVDKTYYAKVKGILTEKEVESFASGFEFKDFTSRPSLLKILGTDTDIGMSEALVTIHEGKFHQVRRMFLKTGCEVTELKRIAMGSLELDPELKAGEYRELTVSELEYLKNCGKKQTESEETAVLGVGRSDIMENIEAVIFDLDGTLVDSMWMWKQIDIDYLARYGIELPEDLQSCIEGMSFTESAAYFKKRFGIPDEIDEIKKSWNEMAIDMYRTQVGLKPGAGRFLQYLKGRGIRVGIATSNSPELVRTVMEGLGVRDYFDEIHTACEVEHGKPKPDIYLYVAECLGVAPERCLVFEDIIPGITAGLAAGMRTCTIDDDFSADELENKIELADYYYPTFNELLEELM